MQENTHENYAIAFTDGTVKVGTTCRSTKRIKEVVRGKIKTSSGVGVVAFFIGKLLTREAAYTAERNTCYLHRFDAIPGHREWFKSAHYDAALLHQFLKMDLGMFGHGVGLIRAGAK